MDKRRRAGQTWSESQRWRTFISWTPARKGMWADSSTWVHSDDIIVQCSDLCFLTLCICWQQHSCEPNMFVQNVFTDSHDPAFPVIAFFTNRCGHAHSHRTVWLFVFLFIFTIWIFVGEQGGEGWHWANMELLWQRSHCIAAETGNAVSVSQ